MIVYGTGGKKLGEVKILNEKCPHCEEYNNVYLHGIARYFHVFWIPIFPFNKKMLTVCHACDSEIKKKERSQSLKDKITLEKGNFKTPIYLFIGLALIVGLIGYFEFNSKKHKEFVKNRLHHLVQDDVIVVKDEAKNYSFARVENVSNDTIYFVNSNYSIDQKPTMTDYTNGITEKTDFYSDEIYYFTEKQIDSLQKLKRIDIFEIEEN